MADTRAAGDTSASRPERFAIADLQGTSPRCGREFCSQLHTDGFAVIRLTDGAAEDFCRLRAAAQSFFAQPAEAKMEVLGERTDGVGGEGVGYRDQPEHDSEFLETYLTAAGTMVPSPAALPDELAECVTCVHRQLSIIAREILLLCAAHVRLPPEAVLGAVGLWAGAVDGGDESAATASSHVGSTLLRVCHYRPAGVPVAMALSEASANAEGEQSDVLFLPHTDSTLLTLSPVNPVSPGLQLQQSGGAWLDVESLPGSSTVDVEVHAGDYLSILSRGYFYALRHRVVRSNEGLSRISCPLLLRPRDAWRRERGWLAFTEARSSSESSDESQGEEEVQKT